MAIFTDTETGNVTLFISKDKQIELTAEEYKTIKRQIETDYPSIKVGRHALWKP